MNGLGRVAAWAGLLMVLQQTMIVFLQRIFRVSDISVGPFGTAFTRDLSWYSEELKLYNAMIVCLCVAWTFIQGGHVRVDLVYSAVSHRTKRAIDMAGCVLFMVPFARAALALRVVLLLAVDDHAGDLGVRDARPAADEGARGALERRDHQLQPERLRRVLPVQGVDPALHRDRAPAGR